MPCGALHGTRDREGQAAPAAPRAGWASAATLSWPASRVVPRPSRGRARRDAAASNRETQGLTALSLPLFCKTATVLKEHSCGQLPSAKMHVRADGDPRPRGLPGSHPAPETLGQPPAPWGRPTLRREARSRGGRVARLPPPRTRMEPAPRARLRRPPHPARMSGALPPWGPARVALRIPATLTVRVAGGDPSSSEGAAAGGHFKRRVGDEPVRAEGRRTVEARHRRPASPRPGPGVPRHPRHAGQSEPWKDTGSWDRLQGRQGPLAGEPGPRHLEGHRLLSWWLRPREPGLCVRTGHSARWPRPRRLLRPGQGRGCSTGSRPRPGVAGDTHLLGCGRREPASSCSSSGSASRRGCRSPTTTVARRLRSAWRFCSASFMASISEEGGQGVGGRRRPRPSGLSYWPLQAALEMGRGRGRSPRYSPPSPLR